MFSWALESWIWDEQGCGTCWAGAQGWAEELGRVREAEGGTECPLPSRTLGNQNSQWKSAPGDTSWHPAGAWLDLVVLDGFSEVCVKPWGRGAGSRTLHVGRGVCAPPLLEQRCAGCPGVLGLHQDVQESLGWAFPAVQGLCGAGVWAGSSADPSRDANWEAVSPLELLPAVGGCQKTSQPHQSVPSDISLAPITPQAGAVPLPGVC